MRRSSVLGAVAASTIAVLLISATTTGAAPPNPVPESGAVGPAQRLGLQQVPKDVGATANAGSALSSTAKGANPLIALLPDPSRADYAYWKAVLAKAGKARAAQKAQVDARNLQSGLVAPAVARRRAGTRSTHAVGTTRPPPRSTSRSSAAPPASGPWRGSSGRWRRPGADAVRAGARRQRFDPARRVPFASPSAADARRPRGRSATVRMVRPGTAPATSTSTSCPRRGRVRHSWSTSTPSLLPRSTPWSWSRTPPATRSTLNDDDGLSFDSRLSFTIPRNGDYFVSVAGFPHAVPQDPFDSGSGPGAGSEGAYTVIFGLDADDIDFYGVDLRAGDVRRRIGDRRGSDIAVLGPLGGRARRLPTRTRPASIRDRRPCPEAATRCSRTSRPRRVAIRRGHRRHRQLRHHPRGLPPGPGVDRRQAVQTIFLDFDGARVNTRSSADRACGSSHRCRRSSAAGA